MDLSSLTPWFRPLGSSSLRVTAIGLGCVTFGREIDRVMAERILDHAFARGIRLFDTAEQYGDGVSESIVGEWVRRRGVRSEVVLATKIACPLSRENIRRGVEASRRRLQVEVIDLYQLHSWDPATPLEETVVALEEEVHRGRIREAGCSNFSGEQLSRALDRQLEQGARPFASVQSIYNLAQREAEAEVFACCVNRRVGLITYSPLGAGFLTGKYSRAGAIPAGTRFAVRPGHQKIYFNEAGDRAVELLRAHAAASGISMIQLALSWIFRREEISTVLIGARDTDHIDQALEARAQALDRARIMPGT